MKRIAVVFVTLISFGFSVNAQVIINQDNKKQTEELENTGCGYSIETAKSSEYNRYCNNVMKSSLAGFLYTNSCKYKNYKVKVTYKQYKTKSWCSDSNELITDLNSTPEILTKIIYLKPTTEPQFIECKHCEYVDDECLNCDN